MLTTPHRKTYHVAKQSKTKPRTRTDTLVQPVWAPTRRRMKTKKKGEGWKTEMRGWKKSEGKTVTKRDEDRNMGKEGET